MTSGCAFARFTGRALSLVALIIFFYLVYCGATVGKLLDDDVLGARTTMCLDAGHMRRITEGSMDDAFKTESVRRALAFSHARRRGMLDWHLQEISVWIGLKLFWTEEQRSALYKDVESRLLTCRGALNRYKERTGKDWSDPKNPSSPSNFTVSS